MPEVTYSPSVVAIARMLREDSVRETSERLGLAEAARRAREIVRTDPALDEGTVTITLRARADR